MNNDIEFMQRAVELAKIAADNDEVPVGAVLVADNKIIGEGWNRPIQTCDPTAHAEMIALREGATVLKNYRLIETTLYVTLEPCRMCMGAIVHARVKRVVFAAPDGRGDELNHHVQYEGGILAESCGQLLKDFFKVKRNK